MITCLLGGEGDVERCRVDCTSNRGKGQRIDGNRLGRNSGDSRRAYIPLLSLYTAATMTTRI